MSSYHISGDLNERTGQSITYHVSRWCREDNELNRTLTRLTCAYRGHIFNSVGGSRYIVPTAYVSNFYILRRFLAVGAKLE